MSNLRHDLHHAIRHLLRAPAVALTIIVTLALGIGANTAIFSVVNGVLLRPLGYPRPEQLLFITSQFPSMGFDQFWVSPPEYFEFQEMNRSFSAVGAYAMGEVNLMGGDRPRRVRAAAVTHDLLAVLGVQPHQGRLFGQGETDRNGPQVAILSHELWRSALASAAVLGRTLEIDGIRREIIGIMPPGTDLMDAGAEVWLPLGLDPGNRRNRGNHFLYVVGRLKDGVTLEGARAELTTLIVEWDARFKGQHSPNPRNHQIQLEPLQAEIVGGASRAIWVLQAAVGCVLLIACANLANLLLARAETRSREFAVRTALGAGRARLLQQFMTEGVLLAVLGGALGVLVAHLGLRLLLALYPESLPRAAEVGLDVPVLLFTLFLSLLVGVVFGLAPLLHTSPAALATSLKEGGARGATAGARQYVRRGLVTAEVALAVMMVICAGLMLRTVWNLTRADAGFDRARLVTFSLDLPFTRYTRSQDRAAFYQRLLETLRRVPAVQGAAAMTGLPPDRDVNANDTEIDNYTAPEEGPFENVDYYQTVTTGYFETLGVPILAGRPFEPADTVGSPVAVVNETLVRTFWRDRNPLGQRLKPSSGDAAPWFTVIGVAKDVKQGGVDQKTGTELYMLADQIARIPSGSGPDADGLAPAAMHIVLRTTLAADALAATVERAVRDQDPALPVVRLRDMDAVFAEAIRRPRLIADLLAVFGGLALLLAAIGTYGVLSYMVAERRRELGIRMALGARRSSVLALVMRQGLLLTAAGLAIGLVGAFGLTRLMTSLLYGVHPSDPATAAGVVVTIATVAAAACYLPAYRASRVDPVVVLREE